MLMKREHAISRCYQLAIPCPASSSKWQSVAPLQQSCRSETDCFSRSKAIQDGLCSKPYACLSLTVSPKKRHVSLTPTGESACLTHFQRQDPARCPLGSRRNGLRLTRGKQRKKTLLSLEITLSTRCNAPYNTSGAFFHDLKSD